jgi:hypothetical protein
MNAVTARAPDPDQIVAALMVRDSRVLLCHRSPDDLVILQGRFRYK